MLRRRRNNAELSSPDVVTPVCQPSDTSTPPENPAADSGGFWQDRRPYGSSLLAKTSTWLLQQDADQRLAAKDGDAGLESVTQSSIYVGSKSSVVNVVAASRSEPVLSQHVTLGDDGVGNARSSATVVASEQGFAGCDALTPASPFTSRQKNRQLRFCAVPAVEEHLPGTKESDVDRRKDDCRGRTFPPKNTSRVEEEADGVQWVSARNDVEELSVEDAASLANSNTSLSDTCNSSFKSSTEDLANHGLSCADDDSVPTAADVTSRLCSGLRHRKRRPVIEAQGNHGFGPAQQCEQPVEEEREENSVGIRICQEQDLPMPESGGSLQPADIPAVAAVGESPRAAMSSDDDDDSHPAPHISPSKCRLHPRHARRPCSVRAARSGIEKFLPCHVAAAADVASPKDRGSRAEGRRSNVRIDDVRLLESTGMSSADSDAEAARLSLAKAASAPKASKLPVTSKVVCFHTFLFVLTRMPFTGSVSLFYVSTNLFIFHLFDDV